MRQKSTFATQSYATVIFQKYDRHTDAAKHVGAPHRSSQVLQAMRKSLAARGQKKCRVWRKTIPVKIRFSQILSNCTKKGSRSEEKYTNEN